MSINQPRQSQAIVEKVTMPTEKKALKLNIMCIY